MVSAKAPKHVNKKLGLSPGYHTQRLARLRDYQRSKQRVLANTRAFKKKRLARKRRCTKSLHLQKLEKVSPIKQDALLMQQYRMIFSLFLHQLFLRADYHIIHLPAFNSQNTKFNRYIHVKPDRPISPQASEVTGLKFQNRKMYHHDREVQSIGIPNAFKAFILFLKWIHY
ncbi:hypothetical protein AM593_01190, partial [Mytilus galloprovincialis]